MKPRRALFGGLVTVLVAFVATVILLLALNKVGPGPVGTTQLQAACASRGGIRTLTYDGLTVNSTRPGYFVVCNDGVVLAVR